MILVTHIGNENLMQKQPKINWTKKISMQKLSDWVDSIQWCLVFRWTLLISSGIQDVNKLHKEKLSYILS